MAEEEAGAPLGGDRVPPEPGDEDEQEEEREQQAEQPAQRPAALAGRGRRRRRGGCRRGRIIRS